MSERPDSLILPPSSVRMIARLIAASGGETFGPAHSEALAYLARKARRRIRQARKCKRGWA